MTKAIFINNSNDDNIYDVTIKVTKNDKTIFLDISFDRRANANSGCDATQFEKDIKDLLLFLDDQIIIE